MMRTYTVGYGTYNQNELNLARGLLSASPAEDYMLWQDGAENLKLCVGRALSGLSMTDCTVYTITFNGYGSPAYGYTYTSEEVDAVTLSNPQNFVLYNSETCYFIEKGNVYEKACCVSVCVLFLFLLCREFFRAVS